MRVKIELAVETEHYIDLKGIAELTKNAWVHRSEMEKDFSEIECIMRKTEDGYWQTVTKSNTGNSDNNRQVTSSLKGR